MKVFDLSRAELVRRLKADGLTLAFGSFVVNIRSSLWPVVDGLGLLYADFPVLDRGSAFVDFEVEVCPPNWLRRRLRPQATFRCDGRTPFKPLPAAQALPMLEWGLNWMISSHAHDHLVLHAGVVERDGRAIVLAADPGSGKSTLCAALVHRGWRLLSDELALVSLVDGSVRPIARPISLKGRSIDIVRALGTDVVLSEVCHDTAKGSVALMKPPAASVQAMTRDAMPALLVFPRYDANEAPSCERVGTAHAVVELCRHAFNASVLTGVGFDALCRLAEATQAFRIRYPTLDDAIAAIETHWRGSR